MNSIKIIATLGIEYLLEESFERIESLINIGIDCFRVNLSKYENFTELYKICIKLKELRVKFGNSISLMLDLPLPYTKTRIYNSEGLDYLEIKKGDVIKITSCYRMIPKNNLFYINIGNGKVGDKVKINQHISYADGELDFIVEDIAEDKETISLSAVNPGIIFSRKALNTGVFLDNTGQTCEYLQAISDINPDGIFLSFVSEVQYLEYFRKQMENFKVYCPLISKIESLNGVKNIDSISKKTDIMIARGDLSLNIDINTFWKTELKLSEVALKNNCLLYIATGILSSLATSNMPSPSEIVDLSTMLYLQPSALILNFGIVRSPNFNSAIRIIKSMFS